MSTVDWDVAATTARLVAASKSSIAAVANQALKDANALCKEDTGALIGSSLTASDTQNGLLVWNEPYAKRQYYTGQASHDKNTNATTMWAHKGYAAHRGEYELIAQKVAGTI